MKYQQSQTQCGEFLRLALPLMSKQAAGVHPVSYAVWFEHVAGINRPLSKAIDEITRDGSRLNEEQTQQLYQQYISELDEESAKRISAGFQEILSGISRSAADAGDQANQFGNKLEKLSDDLGQSLAGIDTQGNLAAVLGDTRKMQNAVGALKSRLDESQNEIERLRQEVDRAREDALIDALTGLCNRRGFDRSLDACLQSSVGSMGGPSLLMADIDHFKRVNDTYGHLFGDKVIRALAKILQQNVKGMDTAARYGGEEFIILLPDTSIQNAFCVAEKIRLCVERCRIRRNDNDQELAQITMSFGVASYISGEAANQLIERADSALYRSKESGRNRVTVADAGAVH